MVKLMKQISPFFLMSYETRKLKSMLKFVNLTSIWYSTLEDQDEVVYPIWYFFDIVNNLTNCKFYRISLCIRMHGYWGVIQAWYHLIDMLLIK